MTRFLLIWGPPPGVRRVSEMSPEDLERSFSVAARAAFQRGEHVHSPDGRVYLDLLAYYDAMQRISAAPSKGQP